MLLKLAFRNVRRSARDYSIYFVTLLFSVALFYAFNSISSQKALFDMEQGLAEAYFESFTIMMGLVSFVIAFVLAFLIIYANRFLIKRRKREFGTYLLLGMTPAQVSTIVVIETACVGVVSLALGLLLGMLVSQGLSFVTAALFAVKLDAYHFIFSPLAFFVTVVCFAVLFAVTALFNVVQVRRCKLSRCSTRKTRASITRCATLGYRLPASSSPSCFWSWPIRRSTATVSWICPTTISSWPPCSCSSARSCCSGRWPGLRWR